MKIEWVYKGKHYSVREIEKRSGDKAWAVCSAGEPKAVVAQYRSRNVAVQVCSMANEAGSWSAARPAIRLYLADVRKAGIVV